MKRKGNLYKNLLKHENIIASFKEVKQNTRNERRVYNMMQYKAYYYSTVYKIIKSENYVVGDYNKFIIKEPKIREIVSQNVVDKIINHLFTRYVLYPAILPCLLDVNVASRLGMGTSEGLKIAQEYYRKCKVKYGVFYILKGDISKFFASINHDILKKKVRRRIKDKRALKMNDSIIDSNNPGLFIGAMSSQLYAIFYLNDFDHFVKEELNIKYYIRYQDDFLLFHESKEYLKYCYEQIKIFLEKEDLILNIKTRIYKNTDNIIFLGRNFKGRYVRYRSVKRKIKHRRFLYYKKLIPLNSLVSSISCYEGLLRKEGKELYTPILNGKE